MRKPKLLDIPNLASPEFELFLRDMEAQRVALFGTSLAEEGRTALEEYERSTGFSSPQWGTGDESAVAFRELMGYSGGLPDRDPLLAGVGRVILDTLDDRAPVCASDLYLREPPASAGEIASRRGGHLRLVWGQDESGGAA